MYLSDFRSLIASMPTAYHSTTAERGKWKEVLGRNDSAGRALRSVFRDFGTTANEVCISRSDLRRLAKEAQLERFVMATILWGYEEPFYLRGNNLSDFIADPTHLSKLTHLLISARVQPITEWDGHWQNVTPTKGIGIRGIGLSTYTKFLNFLPVKVHGNTALILDTKIVRVLQQGVFAELNPLRELTDSNKDDRYPTYLSCIHKISNELRVPAENIELFLYIFGSDLKDIAQNIRLRAYELYEQRGRVDGLALDDWLKAEAKIRGGTPA